MLILDFDFCNSKSREFHVGCPLPYPANKHECVHPTIACNYFSTLFVVIVIHFVAYENIVEYIL